jgi:hypothetical protein
VGWIIGQLLLTTHSPEHVVPESFYASAVSGNSHRSEALFTAPMFYGRILHRCTRARVPSGITPI